MYIGRNTDLKASALSDNEDPDFCDIPIPLKFTRVCISREIVLSSIRRMVELVFSALQRMSVDI